MTMSTKMKGVQGEGPYSKTQGLLKWAFEWIFLGTFAPNPNFLNFSFAFSQIKRQTYQSDFYKGLYMDFC